MKYCLMLEDGQYHETNFTFIVMNAYKAGYLDELVVLKPNSSFHDSLDIDPSTIVIVDSNKKFLSRMLELVIIQEDEVQEKYLEYLDTHYIDGDSKSNCCDEVIIENTDLCNVCKEHSEVLKPVVKAKPNWKKFNKEKDNIKAISNIYFDTFDLLEDNIIAEYGLINIYSAIKLYLSRYGYTVLHRNHDFIGYEKLNTKPSLSDSIGKFFIIKDIDSVIHSKETRPMTLFAPVSEVGYIIGNQGKRINLVKEYLNKYSKHLVVPYINIKKVEDRTTSNVYSELVSVYKKVLNNIVNDILEVE